MISERYWVSRDAFERARRAGMPRDRLCNMQEPGMSPCAEPAIYSYWRSWTRRDGTPGRACQHHWNTTVERQLVAHDLYRRTARSPAYARASPSNAGVCGACDRLLGELIFVYTTPSGAEVCYCARRDCGAL